MADYFNWIKAAHIISMVCWFAAIFYLPRLFVYHAMSEDKISQDRFVIMERKLYRGIMTPSMIATWIFGLWMVELGWEVYKTQGWLHVKILLVILLSAYHGACGFYRKTVCGTPSSHTREYQMTTSQLKHHIFVLLKVQGRCILPCRKKLLAGN